MDARELAFRLKSHWRFKLGLLLGLTFYFLSIYLSLQRYIIFPVHIMKPSKLDFMIPFMPDMVYLYESFWFLMVISPWLMISKKELQRHAAGIFFMSAAGFLVFFFYPTLCPRPKASADVNVLYGALTQIDMELNSFPSLHAAFAVFHGLCCHAIFSSGEVSKYLRGFIWFWVFGIIASTLLTKQHVIADAIAGMSLGFFSYRLFPSTESYFQRRELDFK